MSKWKSFLRFLELMANATPSRPSERKIEPLNTLVDIEYLTDIGTWIPWSQTQPDSFFIASALQNAKRQFPNNRVRAVDHQGRLLDMLP